MNSFSTPRRPVHRAARFCGRTAAATAGSVIVLIVTALPALAQEDVTVDPSWEGAPWVPQVEKILNVTAQLGLACCVLSLLLGGAAMGVGRLVGSYQAGHRGLQLILGGGGGALIIASAASIVRWLIGGGQPA
jgi:hypothetical protein